MYEKPDWKSIAKDFFTNPDRMGGFYRTLCLAIQMADYDNVKRLRQGFPELVPLILDEKTPREVEDEFEAKP